MISDTPLFSIVIPRRNRAHLLDTALRSALSQRGFDDFEVIVSDNSLDQSAARVAEAQACHRLRYVATGEDLDVYGSWDFALRQARGRYTFLLADDDCLTPSALSTWARALRRHQMPEYLGVASCWYSHKSRKAPPHNAMRFDIDWDEEGLRDPRQMLSAFFRFGRPSFSPTYIVVAASIRDALYARGVRPYTPIYPDFAFNAYALALSSSAAVMRDPTVVHGYARESLGEQAFGRREKIAWDVPAGDTEVFRHSPLTGYTFANGWLETLLRVKEALPEQTAEVPIGWAHFIRHYGELLFFEGKWRDVREDLNEYAAFIQDLPEPSRDAVLEENRELLRTLDRLVSVQAWDKLLGDDDQWLQGEHHGFDDIIGGADGALRLYRARRQRAEILAHVLGKGR